MLPPESSRTAAAGDGHFTSYSAMIPSAKRRAAAQSIRPRRDSAGCAIGLADGILGHRHVADQPDGVAVLGNAGDAALDDGARPPRPDRFAEERDRAGARLLQAADQVGKRALSVAGDAGDADDLAAAHVEIDAVEQRLAVAAADRHAAEPQMGLAGGLRLHLGRR